MRRLLVRYVARRRVDRRHRLQVLGQIAQGTHPLRTGADLELAGRMPFVPGFALAGDVVA